MNNYLITNGIGYLDDYGDFGAREDAIEFTIFQAIAISIATGFDYEEK